MLQPDFEPDCIKRLTPDPAENRACRPDGAGTIPCPVCGLNFKRGFLYKHSWECPGAKPETPDESRWADDGGK